MRHSEKILKSLLKYQPIKKNIMMWEKSRKMTSEVQAASHSNEHEASKIENIFDLYYTYPINN